MKKSIKQRAREFTKGVQYVALQEVQPQSQTQFFWFLRHAFRMGWNAAQAILREACAILCGESGILPQQKHVDVLRAAATAMAGMVQ